MQICPRKPRRRLVGGIPPNVPSENFEGRCTKPRFSDLTEENEGHGFVIIGTNIGGAPTRAGEGMSKTDSESGGEPGQMWYYRRLVAAFNNLGLGNLAAESARTVDG